MCLRVDNTRHFDVEYPNNKAIERVARPFIADRPLIVKKRVRRQGTWFRSPYMDTIIDFQRLLETTLDIRVGGYSGHTLVDRGFHAFLYSATPKSWKRRNALTGPKSTTIYGVIPVGAKYYIGTDDEVVSDKITYYKSLTAMRNAFGIKNMAKPHKGSYSDGK